MTREEIEKRLAELRKILEQIQANGNATLGAITECEMWLRKMEESEAKWGGAINSSPVAEVDE